MVVVVSRFRVANAMEGDVVRAFRDRPRAVEGTPGFLWLEVFVDHIDPAVFYLVTRWSDLPAFERWHTSPAHRDSHALIPKGLKLDPSFTQVTRLHRIDGTLGPPVTEALADVALLAGTVVAHSTELFFVVLGPGAVVRTCNAAANRLLEPEDSLEGRPLTDYMPEPDAVRLRALLARPGRYDTPMILNLGPVNRAVVTLECWADIQGDGATLLGHPAFRREQQLQDELMTINQDLAALSRDRARLARDERQAREAAETLNRERNAFLAVLGHELRQPIASALAAMGVQRALRPDPALDRSRAVLERQLLQISRLVDDLADIARMAAGDVELRQDQVDLVDQLRELGTAWEVIAQQQHKTFVSRLPEGTMVVTGDTHRLQQIFSNLMNNALKYTPASGAVALSLHADGGMAVVDVEDEGEGIPPERLPHIFDLFQRATRTGSGLGVGLAVVKALVTAHGGSVTVASAGAGQGATFTVRLPLARSSTDSRALVNRPGAQPRPRAVP
jgi:signal transduction histidine kinase/heme-degrading monooxygenase HmoA